MLVVWRILFWVHHLKESRCMDLGLPKIESVNNIQTFRYSWVVLKIKSSNPSLVLNSSPTENMIGRSFSTQRLGDRGQDHVCLLFLISFQILNFLIFLGQFLNSMKSTWLVKILRIEFKNFWSSLTKKMF